MKRKRSVVLECHPSVDGAGASMRFEKRHGEGSSGITRLHVDSGVSGYAGQMATAVPAHQYSM